MKIDFFSWQMFHLQGQESTGTSYKFNVAVVPYKTYTALPIL